MSFPETVYIWNDQDDSEEIYVMKRLNGYGQKDKYSCDKRSIYSILWRDHVCFCGPNLDYIKKSSDLLVWFDNLEECLAYRKNVLQERLELITKQLSSIPKLTE